jgi:hypothetical protein
MLLVKVLRSLVVVPVIVVVVVVTVVDVAATIVLAVVGTVVKSMVVACVVLAAVADVEVALAGVKTHVPPSSKYRGSQSLQTCVADWEAPLKHSHRPPLHPTLHKHSPEPGSRSPREVHREHSVELRRLLS